MSGFATFECPTCGMVWRITGNGDTVYIFNSCSCRDTNRDNQMTLNGFDLKATYAN
jgi:hypothetical protein